eukprot:1101176_1
MKLSLLALTSILGTSSAFAPQGGMGQSTIVNMADINTETTEVAVEEVAAPIDDTPQLPEMSMAMPFMKRPVALTGALAGDVGFDPIGFAKSESDLMYYRE